jgi:hypothetical protein
LGFSAQSHKPGDEWSKLRSYIQSYCQLNSLLCIAQAQLLQADVGNFFCPIQFCFVILFVKFPNRRNWWTGLSPAEKEKAAWTMRKEFEECSKTANEKRGADAGLSARGPGYDSATFPPAPTVGAAGSFQFMPWVCPASLTVADVAAAQRRIATWVQHVGGDWGTAKGWVPQATFSTPNTPVPAFPAPVPAVATGPGTPTAAPGAAASAAGPVYDGDGGDDSSNGGGEVSSKFTHIVYSHVAIASDC